MTLSQKQLDLIRCVILGLFSLISMGGACSLVPDIITGNWVCLGFALISAGISVSCYFVAVEAWYMYNEHPKPWQITFALFKLFGAVSLAGICWLIFIWFLGLFLFFQASVLVMLCAMLASIGGAIFSRFAYLRGQDWWSFNQAEKLSVGEED